jgi:acyl dehydratase
LLFVVFSARRHAISMKCVAHFFCTGSMEILKSIEMNEEESNLARRFQPDAPVEVTADKIANFCTAVGDLNPLYLDAAAAAAGPYGGIIAPPWFAASIRRGEGSAEQNLFPRGGLMAGIDLELKTPIRPGDAISVATEVKETYEKTGRTGTMTFTVIRSTLTNQKSEVVAYVDYRMMKRQR